MNWASQGVRKLSLVAIAIAATIPMAASMRGQTTSGNPGTATTSQRFEVASIKVDKSGQNYKNGTCHGTDSQYRSAMMVPPPLGECIVTRYTLKSMINFAFNRDITPLRVDETTVGGPKWANATLFNVEAKAPERNTTRAQLLSMMQALLAERFRLRFHWENRKTPGYVLTVAAGGPKFKPTDTGTPGGMGTDAAIKVTNNTIDKGLMTSLLSLRELRPRWIVNETNLTGTYTFEMKWTPSSLDAIDTEFNASAPSASIFQALKEQLGLELKARDVMMPVFVIDSAELPSEN